MGGDGIARTPTAFKSPTIFGTDDILPNIEVYHPHLPRMTRLSSTILATNATSPPSLSHSAYGLGSELATALDELEQGGE
jgi:hypothetical protein